MASYILEIRGNQEDPFNGNPIPCLRMTQKSKWSKKAKRYLAWKKYVVGCWIEQFGEKPMFSSAKKYRLNVDIRFRGERHGDPTNIRRGIEDALFQNDKHVAGYVEFDHQSIPGVRIEVIE